MFKKLPALFSLLISIFFISDAIAQGGFMSSNAWKKQRSEIYLGIGASNFLGDLGGQDDIGKDFSYADLELALTRPSLTLGYRYRALKFLAFRADFNYMRVYGSDELTQEPVRNNRNLSFRSPITEISALVEVTSQITTIGNRYHIKKTLKRRYKASSQYIYGFIGIGVFHFNPQALYNGSWVNLQPLSTEGQGLPGGPKAYRKISTCIPFGFGYRLNLSRKLTLGLEYNFRKTTTDYIDDVSGVYYDKNLLLQYKGPVAVALSDPSKGDIPGATSPNADGTGAQRGDIQRDSYMCIELKIGYFLDTKSKKRTRSKF
jgi:hypothetical protein